jgi:hypothetical protein
MAMKKDDDKKSGPKRPMGLILSGPGKGGKGNLMKTLTPIKKIAKTSPKKSIAKKKATPAVTINEKKPVINVFAPKVKKNESVKDSVSYNKYVKANAGIKSKMPYDQWEKNNKPVR